MQQNSTMAGNISDESVHDPSRGFAGGYYIQTISLGPAFMASFVEPGAWGPSFTRLLDAYENTDGCWLVGEDMPQESNAVTLDPTVTDQHGLPVASVHFDDHPNDLTMREHAYGRAEALYEAVGAVGAHIVDLLPPCKLVVIVRSQRHITDVTV